MSTRPLSIAGLSDVGRKRSNNEDAFLILTPDPLSQLPFEAVLLVADGMGGHERGEVASAMVCEIFNTLFSGQLAEFLSSYQITRAPQLLEILIPEIHGHLASLSEPDSSDQREKMGTTLTVALIWQHHLTLGHVGDSRAYLVRGDQFAQLTEDHTMAHRLVKAGKMTPEEAARSKYRNALSQALGASKKVQPDLLEIELEPGDRLLLCTDGLTRHLEDHELVEILSRCEPEAACAQLVDAANARGGRDNITTVVAHYP
jgi:serine/threonine protein phosphatase PrpC